MFHYSAIIFCLSSRGIYLFLGISLSFSFVIASELFCCEFCENFIVLLATLLLIKSPVAAIFLMALFEVILSASVADCLA